MTGLSRPAGAGDGLNIGGGANLEPAPSFSGRSDDLRIYNQVVQP